MGHSSALGAQTHTQKGKGRRYFALKSASKVENFRIFSLISLQNNTFPGPPFEFSKSAESQLSLGEKFQHHNYLTLFFFEKIEI